MKDLLELGSGRSFYFSYQMLCQSDWFAQELAVVKISVEALLGHQTLVVPGLAAELPGHEELGGLDQPAHDYAKPVDRLLPVRRLTGLGWRKPGPADWQD